MAKRKKPETRDFEGKLRDFPLYRTRQELKANGFSRIKVLLPHQVEPYTKAAWDWVKSFGTGIDEENPKTLTPYYFPPGIRGLVQHYKVGHSEFFWRMRQERGVMRIFADLWDCHVEDLLVSFDGMNFGTTAKPNQNKWPHLDQTNKSEGPVFYQGCISLTKTNGGLKFLSGSHDLHSKFVDLVMRKNKRTGLYRLSEEEENWYRSQPNVTEEFVTSEPGELTIWDSRTVHWGSRPVRSTDKTLVPVRICMYVCYIPRNHLLRGLSDPVMIEKAKRKIEDHLKKRIETFESRRMTTHRPYPVKMFSQDYWPIGSRRNAANFVDRPVIRDEDLTEQMRLLIGYPMKDVVQ